MRTSRSTPRALGLVLLALLLSSLTALLPSPTNVVAKAQVAASQLFQTLTCSEKDIAFAMPYTKYVIGSFDIHETLSYGKKSLDLFAGDHAPVLSPINGVVTEKWTDSKGNPAIKIENDCRYVWMLHGNWTIEKDQTIEIGNVVGTEDNHGQSWGANGQPCNGVEGCAEHTHLDVFDKALNDWIDPRDVKAQETKVNESLAKQVELAVKPKLNLDFASNSVGSAIAWVWRTSTLLAILIALIFGIIASLHGISTRKVLAFVGFCFLIIAWILPNVDQWLPNPLGLASTTITTHYGDVRVDPSGTTSTTWTTSDKQKIYAVAPGIVIPTPSTFASYFGEQQVWIEVGNQLWIQYRFPDGSNIAVKPGSRVSPGEVIGTASVGQINLGVSSKNPNEFVSVDDRSYGWIDPEDFLGKSILSGARKAESTFLQLGLALLIIGWFWPRRTQQDDFPFPWDWKFARFQNVQLILGLIILSLGITLDGPWFLWVGGIPSGMSILYFIGRLRYRRSPVWQVPLTTYLGSILGVVAEFGMVLNLGIGAMANPSLLFIRRDVSLNLPTIITPGAAPDWMLKYVQQGDKSYNLSNTSAIPAFKFRYWNGSEYQVDIPQEVWDASIAASENNDCDAAQIIAIAWTESPNFTNTQSENYAHAMGTWQFIPGTWEYYYPDPATRPLRTDVYASADAACRKANNQGLTSATDRATYIDRFAHHPLSESVWNMHDGQAGTAYDLWQELLKRSSSVSATSTTITPPSVPTMSDWKVLDQTTGAGVYQSGNSFLAIADLSQGAQVVLTGGDYCSSLEGHWQELGSGKFFISNGTFFEDSCDTTFPFVKNGSEVSAGAKTSSYQNARYLVISGGMATVVPYSEWVNGNRGTYMTAGLPPEAGTASTSNTLIGVSTDGKLVFILNATNVTLKQAVSMLTALGVPENNIILMDGGGSTQGQYRLGYTRNSGRQIPQGIGIIAP